MFALSLMTSLSRDAKFLFPSLFTNAAFTLC